MKYSFVFLIQLEVLGFFQVVFLRVAQLLCDVGSRHISDVDAMWTWDPT